MKDKNTYMDDLLAGYFSQSISPDQLKELKAWVNASLENKKHFLSMREVWLATISASDRIKFDKDEAFKHFLARTGQVSVNCRRKFLKRIIWQSAAAIAVLITVSYASFRQGSEQVKNRFAAIVIESPWGSKTKTYLPDGTLVWLNSGSKISYSQGFGVNDRKVELSGEGYFEVTRNEKLPFGVKTEELLVDVLGTKFNFRNYPEDEEVAVSLLEGKILVTNNLKKGENARMTPDQRVRLNKITGEMYVSSVKAKNTAEWTNGYLFFDEELLPDIIKELERSYDVKIKISDSALTRLRFYSKFIRKEQTINDVLDILVSTGKIKYSMEGKDITLSAR